MRTWMNTWVRTGALALMLAIIIGACNFPLARGEQESDEDLMATAVAETVQAMNLPDEPAQPTAQITMPAGQPTIPPTMPAQPTSPISGPATATPMPCNKAQFLGETIPDDSQINPGASFTKTWTLKNVGTCTWNSNYKLAFISGEAMGGAAAVNLTQAVAPNQQVVLTVALKAPGTPGTYTGNWALKADDGSVVFNISVKIKVVSATFQVTSVKTNLANLTPDACQFEYNFNISVTSSTAGKVTYYTQNSEGATSATRTLNFSGAGTLSDANNWTISESGDYWLKVYIDNPNRQWFGPYNFNVTCP